MFWYTVESDQHSLRDLRTIQDWFVRYQLNAVPGVAEVASIGGHVQQYQIDVDPNRLRAYNLSLGDVVEAVRNSNQNVGGNVLEANGTWSIVRGVGLVESVDDLEQIVVGAAGRRARLRAPGRRRARRRRVPRGVAGEGQPTRRSAASSWRARARTRSR